MRSNKQKKLESKGWKVGTSVDFLELTAEEAAYVELKLSLSKSLKEIRKRKHLTQKEFAKLIKSSQSRVAKMESGDPSVSLDLLFKSLFSIGATKNDIVKAVSKAA